jgi:hypothetical protein
MKIYLDACCLNRPFDDQSRYRIRLESEVEPQSSDKKPRINTNDHKTQKKPLFSSMRFSLN